MSELTNSTKTSAINECEASHSENIQKVLLVTSRNVLTSCGELRLIKNRAESLFKQYGIATDIIAFGPKSRVDSNKREYIDAGGDTHIISVSSSIIVPMIAEKTINLATKLNKSNNYKAIILSGVGMLKLAKQFSRLLDIQIIIDIHGAVEDTLELSKTGSIINRMKYRTIYYFENNAFRKYLRYADGFFVVTHALEEYLCSRYKMKTGAKFYTVPCATSTDVIPRKEYEENRAKYRLKYNIDDETKVFIYSGGVSVWQCIKETVDLYKKIHEIYPGKTKLLMFSHNIEQLKQITGDDTSIVFDSYRPDELEVALCAGDFSFMLRKDCITNNVAFPNKYLEYVRSEMQIIATPYVQEIANQIKEYGIGYIHNFEEDITKLIEWISINDTQRDTEEILRYNSFNNRLQSFANDINIDKEKINQIK